MAQDFAIIENYLMMKMPEEVGHYEAADISRTADHFLMNSKAKNVVFDFEDTVLMDSSGIGVIIGRYRKVDCFGGKVFLIHCNKQIKRVIHMAGLLRYVEMMN